MELKSETKQGLLKRSLLWCATALSAMGTLLTLSLLTALSLSCSYKQKQKEVFTINLPREIHSLDPLLIRGTAKRYVLFNTQRGLFYYGEGSRLEKHGASDCSWISKRVYECRLTDRKWSDGSSVEAKHYVYTYQQIKKLSDESLSAIRNLKDLKAASKKKLQFYFDKKVENIDHKLTSVFLSPRHENKIFPDPKSQLFSGPYMVKKIGRKDIHMESNPYFDSVIRPSVRGVFVDDPSAALNMFEAGQLDFLRYLESSNVRAYKNVFFAPFAKLDGLFLNPNKISPNGRKALLLSLNFNNLKKLYNSPSSPGCLALPDYFFDEKIDCLVFDLQKARALYKKSNLAKVKLKIYIPSADANEHKKLALWAQAEWMKNLSFKVQVEIVESKAFYEGVKNSKYSIYRKSHALENLGCLNAVASLLQEPEFSGFKKSDDCAAFFKDSLNTHIWAPLGMPHYAHLPSKKFSGYYVNLLGQMGLENLKAREQIYSLKVDKK